MQLIVKLLGNMAGIWLSTMWVATIHFAHKDTLGANLLALALVALILTFVNGLIRPAVRVIAFPLYVITFGLFALVTNALVFSLTGWLSAQFSLPLTVDSFWGAVAGGTITAIISALIVAVLGPMTGRGR